MHLLSTIRTAMVGVRRARGALNRVRERVTKRSHVQALRTMFKGTITWHGRKSCTLIVYWKRSRLSVEWRAVWVHFGLMLVMTFEKSILLITCCNNVWCHGAVSRRTKHMDRRVAHCLGTCLITLA